MATPFIADDPTTNLAKCQRYYQSLSDKINARSIIGNATSSANAFTTFPLLRGSKVVLSEGVNVGIPSKLPIRPVYTDLISCVFDSVPTSGSLVTYMSYWAKLLEHIGLDAEL